MIIILYGVLIVAVIFDLCTYRIPNAWIAAGLTVIFLQVGILNGPLSALNFIFKCLLFLFLFIPLYVTGALGAGDIKLLSLVGACVKFKNICRILFISLILGVILGIIKSILLVILNKSGVQKNTISILLINRQTKRSKTAFEMLERIIRKIERRLIYKGFFDLVKIYNHFVNYANKYLAKIRFCSVHYSVAILIATFIVMKI